LIGVLNSNDELATVVPGEQPIEQCGTDIADMRFAGGTRRVSNSDVFGQVGPPFTIDSIVARISSPINNKALFRKEGWRISHT
jgi:hypothetical protein